MRFVEYVELREAEEALKDMGLIQGSCGSLSESGISSALRRGLLAGALALAPLAAAADAADAHAEPRALTMKKVDWKRPRYMKMIDASKDSGRYYNSSTEKELRVRAEDGDEWALKELPWPKGHPFHKMGRPFFKNDGPHPQGLFPSSGY